jgi:hypothetical protein
LAVQDIRPVNADKLTREANAHLELRKKMVTETANWFADLQAKDKQFDELAKSAEGVYKVAAAEVNSGMTSNLGTHQRAAAETAKKAEALLEQIKKVTEERKKDSGPLMLSRKDFGDKDQLPDSMRDSYKQESGKHFSDATATMQKYHALERKVEEKTADIKLWSDKIEALGGRARSPEQYVADLNGYANTITEATTAVAGRAQKLEGWARLLQTKVGDTTAPKETRIKFVNQQQALVEPSKQLIGKHAATVRVAREKFGLIPAGARADGKVKAAAAAVETALRKFDQDLAACNRDLEQYDQDLKKALRTLQG